MTETDMVTLQADVDLVLDAAQRYGLVQSRGGELWYKPPHYRELSTTPREVATHLTQFSRLFDGSSGPDRLFSEEDDPQQFQLLVECVNDWASRQPG